MVSAEQAAALAYLAMACAVLIVQSIVLSLLRRQPDRRPGLLRTAICRVLCSLIYIGVGINSLSAHVSTLTITLATFAFTQAVWALNGIQDLRLNRPRKGRPRYVSITIGRHGDHT